MSLSFGFYISHYYCYNSCVCIGWTVSIWFDAENEIKWTKDIFKVGLESLKLSVINGVEKLATNAEFSGGNVLRYGKRKAQEELDV